MKAFSLQEEEVKCTLTFGRNSWRHEPLARTWT